mmetsp:Transcript_8357/g.23716  ORF Transcript_8357/g.23716 Transcript_8357/m.23716 type:complete len:201 (-) Transcript_8357:1222-1824(-)
MDGELSLVVTLPEAKDRVRELLGLDLGDEGVVCACSAHHLLVHEVDDAHATFDELQQVRIVLVVHLLPGDALVGVLGLDRREHVCRELLLQLLIRKVDHQLLVAVHFEVLKAKDVQDPHPTTGSGARRVLRTDRRVDAPHQPVKKGGVQGLGQRVPAARGGGLIKGYCEGLPAGRHSALAHGLAQRWDLNSQQGANSLRH